MNIKTHYLILIFPFFLSCWQETTTGNFKYYYNDNQIRIFSPDSTKFIEISENRQNQADAFTQILINFITPSKIGVVSIFTIQGVNWNIDAVWLLDNEILINYPRGITIEKKDTVTQFLHQHIKIYYHEKLNPDSISWKILKYERIGIMDTITATLKGQVLDLKSNMPIQDANISLISGLVLLPNMTNENGMFEYNQIHNGQYRFHIFASGYEKFEMDTLYLGTGDIKEINIGLIKK